MRNNQKGFAHILLIVIVIIGISGILYFSWQKGFIKTNKQKTAPSPTIVSKASPTPYETGEDGVYTNQKFGFRFKYPSDIFTFTGKGVFISSERETDPLKYTGYPGKYTMYLNINDANLNVSDPDGNFVSFYDYYNRPLGIPLFDSQQEKDHFNNDIKIKDIKKNKLIGYIIYRYNTPYADGIESSVSHRADLLHDGLLITLSITSPGSGFEGETPYESERLEILEEIINSLEFFSINPTN